MKKEELEKKFKRFKKKYFKGKEGFTGLELQQCKEAFAKKEGIKLC
jgi:hypothetical protein